MNKGNKLLKISAVLGVLYSIYLIVHFGGGIFGASSDAEAIGGALAATIVAPHMVCVILATIFNVLVLKNGKKAFALTGAILYTVSAVMFFLYAFFVLPMIILSFVGYSKMKKADKLEV